MNKIILRLLIVLGVLFGLAPVCVGQHGGKAEGRRVRFKPGTASAIFNDKVRGSLEIDYELEAQAGQELIVRVVSDPPGSAFAKVYGPDTKTLEMSCLAAKQPEAKKLGLPTAARCFEDNPQLMRREGRTWVATLPESGNYLLSVYKPQGGGVSTYSLLIVVPPAEHPVTQSLAPDDIRSLEAAMRRFIASFKKNDVAGFLSLFSRSGFFYADNPLNVHRIAVPYAELEQDLKKKGNWYCSYLERCDELDAFIDNIGDGEMWLRVGGAKFVPPGSDATSLTFVRWKKEGGRWVIYEISYPQA